MLKPRAEIEGDKKSKPRATRQVAAESFARKAKTLEVLGGQAQDTFKKMRESGKTSGKEYQRAKRAADIELRKNAAKVFKVGDKKAYTKSEQKKNFEAAMELATRKGRGSLGKQGKAQMKDILQASGVNGERIFGKKGAYKLNRALTRTDKGGGKVRKTNKRKYITTQAVQEVSTDSRGRRTVKTIKDGAQKVRYFDASKPLPKGAPKNAVRAYEAKKKGSLKTASAPMIGEDGYKGAPSKGKGKAASRTYKKNSKAETKKPKKEAPSNVKKGETQKKPLPSKEQIQRAVQRATGGQAKPTPAKPQTPATPKPATPRPTTTNKPAPAPKKAQPLQQVPKAGSKTPERKAFLEKQVNEFNQLNTRAKREGIQSLSREDRQTLGIGQRLNADRLKELKSIKTPKKKN